MIDAHPKRRLPKKTRSTYTGITILRSSRVESSPKGAFPTWYRRRRQPKRLWRRPDGLSYRFYRRAVRIHTQYHVDACGESCSLAINAVFSWYDFRSDVVRLNVHKNDNTFTHVRVFSVRKTRASQSSPSNVHRTTQFTANTHKRPITGRSYSVSILMSKSFAKRLFNLQSVAFTTFWRFRTSESTLSTWKTHFQSCPDKFPTRIKGYWTT